MADGFQRDYTKEWGWLSARRAEWILHIQGEHFHALLVHVSSQGMATAESERLGKMDPKGSLLLVADPNADDFSCSVRVPATNGTARGHTLLWKGARMISREALP